MATISENLQTILDIKNDIKDAIIAKGVSVADTDGFATYASKIESIETGTASIDVGAMGLKFGHSTFTEIPSIFDFSNVTNMRYMFYYCSSLTTLPLFDTSSVTEMSYMFYECDNLQTVPLFDTSNVTYMRYMFYNCSNLTSVPLFDTSSVTNMERMFCYCPKLTSVPLFDTSKVTNMSYMFDGCSILTSVPEFNTSKVANMSFMFYNCSNLTSIPLIDASNVTNISSFFGSSNITTLTDLGGFKNLKIDWNDKSGLYRLPNITIESVKNIFNNLYDFRGNGDTTTTRTLKINPSTKTMIDEYYYYEEDADGNMVEEDAASIYAIATNKGWIVESD